MKYQGSCHCGSVSFEFEGPDVIENGIRCNCSICKRKGAVMSSFLLKADELQRAIKNDSLQTYQFGRKVAKHHFCKECGMYTFHETFRVPGSYRVNLGCIDGVDVFNLDYELFDGASL